MKQERQKSVRINIWKDCVHYDELTINDIHARSYAPELMTKESLKKKRVNCHYYMLVNHQMLQC